MKISKQISTKACFFMGNSYVNETFNLPFLIDELSVSAIKSDNVPSEKINNKNVFPKSNCKLIQLRKRDLISA